MVQPKPQKFGNGNRPAMSAKEEAKLIAARKREDEACKLRSAGADYESIAQQLGFKDKSGAWRAVKRAINRIGNESASVQREHVRARANRSLLACAQVVSTWLPRATGGVEVLADGTRVHHTPSPTAAAVVDRAIRTATYVETTLARVNGLFHDKLELTGAGGGPLDTQSAQDELLARLERLAAGARADGTAGVGEGAAPGGGGGPPVRVGSVGTA